MEWLTMKQMGLRLGFHYHGPTLVQEDGVYMLGYLGRFIDSLAEHCAEVICFVHSPRGGYAAYLDYRITASNVTIVQIGPHLSVPRRVLLSAAYTGPLRQMVDHIDVLLLRGPSPLLPAMARAAGRLPVVLLLVGDYVAGIDDLVQVRWRKEAIRLWALWNRWQQRRIARRTLTFVNGGAMFEEYTPIAPQLKRIATSTLQTSDFFERADTCNRAPYRLLHVGRIARAKGLLDVVTALHILLDRGLDVVLDLVGWAEPGGEVDLQELRAHAARHGVAERVVFHGFRPFGPDLFAFYREADVFIIASTHEGVPRTIWEAMANSVPVVASSVGGIPYVLEDGITAKLVAPRDSRALADAVMDIITNPDLRRRLIRNGRKLAQECTLDKVSALMVMHIGKWLAERGGSEERKAGLFAGARPEMIREG